MTDDNTTASKAPLDVAVIGAGISGAYCAYRLALETDQTVGVFEASNRIGGRLWSHQWAGADGTSDLIELGGEAFSPLHTNIFNLACGELGLKPHPHGPFNQLLRYHLRGVLLDPDALSNVGDFATKGGKLLRYFVDPDFFCDDPTRPGKETGDPFVAITAKLLRLMDPAVGETYQALMACVGARVHALTGVDPFGEGTPPPLTIEQAQSFVTAEMVDLQAKLSDCVANSTVRLKGSEITGTRDLKIEARNLGMWSVVVQEFGPEAYSLLLDAGFENSAARQFNFVELAETLLLGGPLFLIAPNFWSLPDGYQSLPLGLVDRVAKAGGRVQLNRRLAKISKLENGILHLEMIDDSGERQSVHAKRVIFTAPLAHFDAAPADGVRLDGFDPSDLERFKINRKAVAAIPAGKLFLVYPRPWWDELSDLTPDMPKEGYGTSSIPLKSVYYRGLCADGVSGLMTGALTDGINNDFWASFKAEDAPKFVSGEEQSMPDLAAPQPMVIACHRLLAEMHKDAMQGGAAMPHPLRAAYHDWRGTGGAWSAWKTGHDIPALAKELRNPFSMSGDGLHCCGDSLAERHGWAEETVNSAEVLLREAFDMPPAPWLPHS